LLDADYPFQMKQRNFFPIQNRKSADAPAPISGHESNGVEKYFAPSPEEVARRAYFCYVNEGSPEGRDVQHWLAAEAQLTAERNLTRTHGFHNHN
jgi:hypothetical protein